MYWVLDAKGEPVLVPGVREWSDWTEAAYINPSLGRHVARTEFANGTFVSTIFLGLDHSWGWGGPPVLWETMVFTKGDWRGIEQDRCAGGRDQAITMHEKMCEAVGAELARLGAEIEQLTEGVPDVDREK